MTPGERWVREWRRQDVEPGPTSADYRLGAALALLTAFVLWLLLALGWLGWAIWQVVTR